jgi:hypothetical protein
MTTSLRAIRPDLVHVTIGGYGDAGPLRANPGHDLSLQAFTGMMSITGEPVGGPMRAGGLDPLHVPYKGTNPAPVTDAIVAATKRVMGDEGIAASLGKIGVEPVADADAQRSAAFFATEIARWGPIVKASGATI